MFDAVRNLWREARGGRLRKEVETAQSHDLPGAIPFKDGRAFFESQCEFGHTELRVGKGVAALVLDARKEFGTATAVKVEADGRQTAIICVAANDGGFIVPAMTPSGRGEPLRPDDVVIWVPSTYSADIAKSFGDKRSGWVGFTEINALRL